MKNKKMDLQKLVVKSFVTAFETNETQTVKGGGPYTVTRDKRCIDFYVGTRNTCTNLIWCDF